MPAAAKSIYCTVFDAGYLAQAIALHASLMRANPRAQLAFVCMDELSARVLGRLALERASIVPYAEFSTPELDRVRALRAHGESIWTCKPFALLHLARTIPDAEWLVYADADVMFFGDPDAALPGPRAHYLLAPHRYHSAFAGYEATAGRYNAGYVAMRNTREGRSVIEWWRDRCVESCSAVPTATTYADQLYLDRIPELFPCGESSAHAGLNAAPWNIERYRVTASGDAVLLDDAPLLLYHFQSLRVLNSWLVDLYAGDRRLAAPVRHLIYDPYLERLQAAYRAMRDAAGTMAPTVQSRLRTGRDWLRLGKGLARGKHNLRLRRIAA